MSVFRELLARVSPARIPEIPEALGGLSPAELEAVKYMWIELWARPEQLPPPNFGPGKPKRVRALSTGRGWGKTLVLAQTVREWAANPKAMIGLVARTAGDLRDVLIEGPSGVLSVFPPDERPDYQPSVRRITFKSGARALCLSADEPNLARGPNFSHIACDEVAAWDRGAEMWANLMLALRIPPSLAVVASTPKSGSKLWRGILASPTTVVTRGRTLDNAMNLSPAVVTELYAKLGGTRLGRQELEGEQIEEVEGALWADAMIAGARVKPGEVPTLKRIVIGVNPAVTSGEDSDSTGIVVCGKSEAGHYYVLEDATLKASPSGWASRVAVLYEKWKCDRVVCEVNNGGDLVVETLRHVRPDLAVKKVTATRGKRLRAEPISALYEQSKVHHAGTFEALESEMTSFAPDRYVGSPDRLDGLVWSLTELSGAISNQGLLDWYAAQAAKVQGGGAPKAGRP